MPADTVLGLEAREVQVVKKDENVGVPPQRSSGLAGGAAATWRRQDARHVVFMGLNTSKSFSGGRYHAWLAAEAAAEMGWRVTFITNDHPSFYHDFDDGTLFPFHKTIDVRISPLHPRNIGKLADIPCDVLVAVPHGSKDTHLYDAVLAFARRCRARIILLNFESANWYNAMSPTPRPAYKWDGWKKIAGQAAMILSLTAEGAGYAREFYDNAPRQALFEHCWPAINDRVADTLPDIAREKRILILTRFSHAEHKGGDLVPDMLCDAMRGHTLVFIVGAGRPDGAFLRPIERRAAEIGLQIEVLECIPEKEKWREFKRAALVLFPSFFEGYGIPPVEARYAGTPCIAFDLPVLREVNGDSIVYVKPGDVEAMREKISLLLSGASPPKAATPPGFSDFALRVDAVLQRALFEGMPP